MRKQLPFSTLIRVVTALLIAYFAAAWMNALLFSLADSSAAWERVANVVWLPGTIATHFTHLNIAARVDHYFYTVLFAGLFFALMRLVRNRIFNQTADLSGR